jgi:hypothetical protein
LLQTTLGHIQIVGWCGLGLLDEGVKQDHRAAPHSTIGVPFCDDTKMIAFASASMSCLSPASENR